MKYYSRNRFFPVPNFLMRPSVGFDISDRSIKFVELIERGKVICLGKFGEKRIPPGVIESGKIKNVEEFKKILIFLKEKYNLSFVRVSLPEQQVYIFKLNLPEIKNGKIRDALELQLEKHIPISAAESVFDYDFINSKKEGGYNFQVAALPKSIIESYLTPLKESGLVPNGFEIEAQAISRAVIPYDSQDTFMIIDFGETRTGISIVSQGIVCFTSTIDIGGHTLTKIIQKSFKVSFEEAEKIKKEYGLKKDPERKEVFSILLNIISVLRDEINKHYIYWYTHKDEDNKQRPNIKKIVLCGRNSNLIGFVDYLSMSMRTKVELGNAWVNINSLEKYVPEISANDSMGYTTSIGLALGDFCHD